MNVKEMDSRVIHNCAHRNKNVWLKEEDRERWEGGRGARR